METVALPEEESPLEMTKALYHRAVLRVTSLWASSSQGGDAVFYSSQNTRLSTGTVCRSHHGFHETLGERGGICESRKDIPKMVSDCSSHFSYGGGSRSSFSVCP